MFKDIENELLSIISDDPIEKIAHMPSKEIAKTMELIYNIKFDDIKRVYSKSNEHLITIIYSSEDNVLNDDLNLINGIVYDIIFIPERVLGKNEDNAITLCRFIVSYVSRRIGIMMKRYEDRMNNVKDNSLNLVFIQAIPIITCAIMKKVYGGPTLPKVIYMTLTESLKLYKKIYSETGVETILDLLDELDIKDLLDNGFICAIKPDDKKYPGIWCDNKVEE